MGFVVPTCVACNRRTSERRACCWIDDRLPDGDTATLEAEVSLLMCFRAPFGEPDSKLRALSDIGVVEDDELALAAEGAVADTVADGGVNADSKLAETSLSSALARLCDFASLFKC